MNQLTDEIFESLKQGSKVEFKKRGSDDLYIGRIEVDEKNYKFFTNEKHYNNNALTDEKLRFINQINDFIYYTYFKVLS